MGVLKSINQKSKEFIFKSFGNDEVDNPAVIVFKRFPLKDELFPIGNQQNIMDSELIKNFDNTVKARKELVEHIVNQMISNITANRIDYIRFMRECVQEIRDLIYEDKNIVTVDDFKTLPEEAALTIAQELYEYAMTEDEFSIIEKKN